MSHLETLGKLLLDAEQASTHSAGMFRISLLGGGEPAGLVMAEGGRICWASSRFYALRLTGVLATEAGIPRPEIEEVFQACRKNGRPLGESLVADGLLSSDQLRQALRHQTAAALTAIVRLMLDQRATVSGFTPARGKTYHPTFTFSGSELIVEAIALSAECEKEAGRPPPTYEALAGDVPRAICLVETGSADLPAIPISLSDPPALQLEEAIRVYRAAKALVRPPTLGALGVEPFAILVRNVLGHGWLAAYQPPHLSLFEARDPFEVVRLLSSLLQEENQLERRRGAA